MTYVKLAAAVAAASLVLGVVACGAPEEDSAQAPATTSQAAKSEFPAPLATPTPDPTQAASISVIAVPRAVPRIEDFEESITPDEASAMRGKTVKVCGTVAEIVPHRVRRHIWVFNFETATPDLTFSILVGDNPQRRHGVWPQSPETYYVGKGLCAVARVELSDGNPFMIINHSDQVEEPEQ